MISTTRSTKWVVFILKRTILAFILFCALMTPAAAAADPAPECSAASMILLHGDTLRVLAEKDADTPRLIASTTKLMTALLASEKGDLDAAVEILPEWTRVEGSAMYLRPGESYTLRELLTGLLLASGNDAALAIAESVSGSAEAFVEGMNDLARELGMDNSHFANPHGLNAEGHFSTARDLARLMVRVMARPVLREILAMPGAEIHGQYYPNHNKLLGSCPGVNGGKTGYTMAAGRCLVSSCERDGLWLVCVTLSDKNDWEDHRSLYDWAYNHFSAYLPEGESAPGVPVISGEPGEAKTVCPGLPRLCLGEGDRAALRFSLPAFVFAPVRAGDTAGTAELLLNGESVYTAPLYWRDSIPLLMPSQSIERGMTPCVYRSISPPAASVPAARRRS